MNVVILNDNAFVNGGAAQIALLEACAMAEAGHQVHLVCAIGPVAKDLVGRDNLKIHFLDLVDVNSDPNRLRAVTVGMWSPRTYGYVQELLQSLDRRETVVHAHSWTRALTSSALKAATDSGCAVVITLHDYLMACPQGTLYLQNVQQKCRLKPMGVACLSTNCDANSYKHKLWRVGRKVIQSEISGVPSRIGHFIYLSQTSLDLLRPHLPATAKLHQLPNPIEVDRLPPADVAKNGRFLFVGRLVPEKGPVMFARAAAAVQAEAQFIGEGSEREAIVRANPAAVLSGWMSHRDGMQTLRSGRALVFPSLWYEGLPLTVLEAASHGLGSIVPHDCAAHESVVDGVTGLHFRSGDEDDLRAKISVLKDPETARRMGEAAYAKFWSSPEYRMDVHVSGLERIYRGMIDAQIDA